MRAIVVPAEDGYPLAAHVFEPEVEARATVLLPAAMGVRQDFYFPFAGWLREQGFSAVAFDYRGIGRSAPATLRGFEASLRDWAEDYNAVLRWAKGQSPGKPVYVVGHSLGGQLLGILPDVGLLDGIVTIAAGSGYWRENAAPLRRWVWPFWFVLVPLSVRLFGYFPGRRLGRIGDVPKSVMLEWRRWCLDEDYLVGALGDGARGGFARVGCPMLSLSFADDEMMSETNIRKLHAFYTNAPLELRRITPQDLGVARIGHFGFFRESFRATLWPQVGEWLVRGATSR